MFVTPSSAFGLNHFKQGCSLIMDGLTVNINFEVHQIVNWDELLVLCRFYVQVSHYIQWFSPKGRRCRVLHRSGDWCWSDIDRPNQIINNRHCNFAIFLLKTCWILEGEIVVFLRIKSDFLKYSVWRQVMVLTIKERTANLDHNYMKNEKETTQKLCPKSGTGKLPAKTTAIL